MKAAEQLSSRKGGNLIFHQEGIQKFELGILPLCKAVIVNGLTKLDEFANLLFGVIFFNHKKSLHRGAVRRESLAALTFVKTQELRYRHLCTGKVIIYPRYTIRESWIVSALAGGSYSPTIHEANGTR